MSIITGIGGVTTAYVNSPEQVRADFVDSLKCEAARYDQSAEIAKKEKEPRKAGYYQSFADLFRSAAGFWERVQIRKAEPAEVIASYTGAGRPGRQARHE